MSHKKSVPIETEYYSSIVRDRIAGKWLMDITCPICKKATPWNNNMWRPFCSERCKLIDLGKWASEEYRIAGDRAKDEEAENQDSKKEDNR